MKLGLIAGTAVAAGVLGAIGLVPASAGPLADVVIADLNNAAELAKANGDAAGAACWTALAGERLNRIVLPPKPGLFELTEAARLTRQNIAKPLISDATAQACGPVARDAAVTINALAGRAGLSFLPIPLPKF